MEKMFVEKMYCFRSKEGEIIPMELVNDLPNGQMLLHSEKHGVYALCDAGKNNPRFLDVEEEIDVVAVFECKKDNTISLLPSMESIL